LNRTWVFWGLPIFRDFISALEERPVSITHQTIEGFSLLSSEFGFDDFSVRLSAFRSSEPGAMDSLDLDVRVSALEEGSVEFRRQLAVLESENGTFSAGLREIFERLSLIESELRRVNDFSASAVAGLRADLGEVPRAVDAVLPDSVIVREPLPFLPLLPSVCDDSAPEKRKWSPELASRPFTCD
jgi:hypothetical protein